MKSRLFLLIITSVLLLVACDPSILSQTYEIVERDGVYAITEYIGKDINVEIPAEIKGRPVAIIASDAFSGKSIDSLTLPSSIKLLEKDCFRGATISSLILPKIDESPIVYPDYPFDSSICVDYPMEIHFDGTKEEFKTLYKNLFQGFKWNTIHVFYTDGDSFFEDIV